METTEIKKIEKPSFSISNKSRGVVGNRLPNSSMMTNAIYLLDHCCAIWDVLGHSEPFPFGTYVVPLVFDGSMIQKRRKPLTY
ncbi:MAG: hypothetical protein JKY55_20155 [Aliivibrio sp.]|nr:hypothetical protein [Aliivibrio sp.]